MVGLFLIGSIIKYLANGDLKILYANGNVAINKQDGMWRSTNNKGKRRAHRIVDGSTFELGTIPCAYKEDEESNTKVLKREDNVVMATFGNGSRYT